MITTSINPAALRWLADERGEDASDMQTSMVNGYHFITTPSHGYLVLGSDDNGYSDALDICRKSNYSYLLNTLVFLEEDCDATAFLALGMVN